MGNMKLLILSCFTSVAFGQLVTHWNGAVTPVDHANFAATAAHLAIKGHPYVYYGKREAEAEPEADPQYLTYGHHLGYSHLGYAGYAGYPYTYYGKREAEADPQYLTYGHHLGYSHLGYAGYAGYPYTSYYGKRGAEADSQYLGYGYGHHLGYSHLGYAGYPYSYYGKRDAEPQVLTYGVHAGPLNFVPAVHHLSYAAVAVPGLVAHPNGPIVPVEPHEVVKARAEHLAAKASA